MEYLDVVDEFGNPTGEIVERQKAHREGIRHRTSHVWIIREYNGIEVLLQKRSENKDSYPGCYDISSAGHLIAGSEYKESALRELKEELGISAKIDELHEIGITYSDTHNIFHGQPFHNVQVSKVYLMWYKGEELTLQKEELSQVEWMNLEVCKQKVINKEMPNCIKISELEMISKYLKR
jgi:Isopentenyldiphosphate isomerase